MTRMESESTEKHRVNGSGENRFGTRFVTLPRIAGVGALIALLSFLTLYPLLMVFYGSLHSAGPGSPGEFNLAGYAAILSPRNFWIFVNTLEISLAKTLISLVVAVFFAWTIARTDTPARRQLEVLITLPFFIPPILTATAWAMLGNPKVGAINMAWSSLTGSPDPIVNVYSFGGVVWHMSQLSVPFLFMFTVDAFRAMDPALEEASRMAGTSQLGTIRRITLPLMLPAITGAFLLSFMHGIESFESPLFFGLPAGISVITTEIYESIYHSVKPNYQVGAALSFAIMLFMFVLVGLRGWLLRKGTYHTVTGKGYTPRLIKLGPWRWLTFALCVLFFLLTVVLPVGQLLVGSFYRFFGHYQLDALTLDHYRTVFDSSLFWRATGNSFLLGLAGASATMALGAVIAYVVTRTRWGGRRIIDALAWLPWMMPGMVLGVGMMWGFAMLPGPIDVYGTLWALFLAYMALGSPIAVRVMSSAYAQLSPDLEESSRVHGAGWWQTLWRILVALSWPSFAVGWVLLLFSIMRELSASVLLYSVNSEVLAVLLWRWWSEGRIEQVSVVGLMLMTLVIVVRWLQLRFLNRRISALY